MAQKTIDGEVLPPARQVDQFESAIDALKASLTGAIEIAFLHGATEWVRNKYPLHYERLLMRFDDSALRDQKYYH